MVLSTKILIAVIIQFVIAVVITLGIKHQWFDLDPIIPIHFRILYEDLITTLLVITYIIVLAIEQNK